jgi:hypothetical protein
MQIDESKTHSENANGSMLDNFESDANVTSERARHPKKQCAQSSVTVAGMQIDASDEHAENVNRPILNGRESDGSEPMPSMDERPECNPNLTSERAVHARKQLSPSWATEGGMQIDESFGHFENADAPIEESHEPGSNVTVERDAHAWKHLTPSWTTEGGKKIEESDKHSEKANSSIRES